MALQRYVETDQSGNPINCHMFKQSTKMGDFLCYATLDRDLAFVIGEALKAQEGLTVLPVVKKQLNQKLNRFNSLCQIVGSSVEEIMRKIG